MESVRGKPSGGRAPRSRLFRLSAAEICLSRNSVLDEVYDLARLGDSGVCLLQREDPQPQCLKIESNRNQ